MEIPLQQREGYEIVFDDDIMTALLIRGRADECVVSFTGIGHALGGIDLQNPEFSGSAGDETKIFIIDKRRSWGNHIDWDRVKSIVGEFAPASKITTLGNSMGGFLAILSAPLLGATCSIAFVPQWSIDPMIVPEEDRWLKYRQDIEKIHYPDLSEAITSSGKIFVFFGEEPKDNIHLNFFKRERVITFILDQCRHNAARYMKNNNVLYDVIAACRRDSDVAGIFTKANIDFTLASGTS